MPNPSASSNSFLNVFKNLWSCSMFLNVVKYFWPCSNMQNYKVKYHFWPCSKIFDQVQKILNKVKKLWTWSKYFWTSRWNRHKLTFVVGEQKKSGNDITIRILSPKCAQLSFVFRHFRLKRAQREFFFFLWDHPFITSRQHIFGLFMTHPPNLR